MSATSGPQAAGEQTDDGASPRVPMVTPMTGADFLEGLRDGREVWIYGERVKDVTTHPAFRNAARMIARMYDALHASESKPVLTCATDTGNGGFTHRFYRVDRSVEDLVSTRDAIAHWARISYGWMGRSPDYKASFLGTLGANHEFYAPFQNSALNWYKKAQERVMFLNHAIVNPPVDRTRPPDELLDVLVHAEKETDGGIIVSGAKVVATGSALTHANFIGCYAVQQLNRPELAVFAMIPMNAPGLKLLCRASYEMTAEVMGSPFDYPLSSRLDENDAILVLDKVFIPWEDIFVYRDVQKANTFFPQSGFLPRFTFHGCTRLAVKFDFLVGLMLKAVEATGLNESRYAQMQVGEAMVWRGLFWALTDAMAHNPEPWHDGTLLPNGEYGSVYRVLATVAYPRVKEMIQQTLSSGLIYLNSHAVDMLNPELRPYIDKYIRGSNGYSSEERIKVLKLLWDAIGSEFGGRHELYERNYAGHTENIRIESLLQAQANGRADALKGFVDSCLAEYSLAGWKAPDLINPHEVNKIFADFARRK